MSIIRTLTTVAAVAVLSVSVAAAAPEGKAGGKKWKKGQGWDAFAAAFDGNKDGKVAKDEMLSKRPAFDRLDTNKDGSVAEDEIDAVIASAPKGGAQKGNKLKGWLSRFDADHDRKVTTAEFDAKRAEAFTKADKNSDGFIDQTEVTGDLMNAGQAD